MNSALDDEMWLSPEFVRQLEEDYMSRHPPRSMKERFRLLCQCQEARGGCDAVRSGTYYSDPLADFLRGQIDHPFCNRGADKVMKGGIFKGRQYCWQHYPAYAVCETCLGYDPHGFGFMYGGAKWVYVWEHHPKRQPRKTYHWEEHGRLILGPAWPNPSWMHKEWAENLIESEEWILQKPMWLCGTCRDVLGKHITSANKKQRNNLIKQAKALKKGKETYTWLRKYLRNNTHGV